MCMGLLPADNALATSAAAGQAVTDAVLLSRRVLDALPPEVRAAPLEACLSAQEGGG